MTDETRFLVARVLATSPMAMPLEDALEHIRRRREKLLATPMTTSSARAHEPNFAPAPMPILDAPATFAADFFTKGAKPLPDPPKPKPKVKKPRAGRKPSGDLPPAVAERFRIVDGGKHDDGDKSPE
jgi:hypothetical protein